MRTLNRGYRLANKSLDIFSSQLIVILAKNVAFFAGSVLAVLVVLTVIDEDVLVVEHVLTTMTVAGLIVTACNVFIPDEHLVNCPEILMRNILAHVHYMPPDWSGNAHTSKVRIEFSIFFQYSSNRNTTSLGIFNPVTQNMVMSSQGSLTGYLSGLQPSGAGALGEKREEEEKDSGNTETIAKSV
uniref:Autophagy-related protein 9 n=1 Tax=Magallana gigas TaxID=29159 RepID=A0A8W8MJ76_MAGGI